MTLDTLVLKIASRCNLNCSYCYMYNLGDLTYKNQPKIMSRSTVLAVIKNVKEYIEHSEVNSFQFIFHGGEPLLAPLSWFKYFVELANKELAEINLTYSLQTNGVLYTKELAVQLDKLKIFIGFSWDGPKHVHDKFRVFHNGKGSYDLLNNALAIHKSEFGHVSGLSVINAEITPEEYYSNIKELDFTSISMLLPIHHHSIKNEYNTFEIKNSETRFGKWLVRLFSLWWLDTDSEKVQLNFFSNYLALIFGIKLKMETAGDAESSVLVIETNGDIECSTSLKACGNGFTKEGLNVSKDKFIDVFENKLMQVAIKSHTLLCETCKQCKMVDICGGGRINERFSNEKMFDNPSVYCEDYKLLITHIQNVLLKDFSSEELENLNLSLLK